MFEAVLISRNNETKWIEKNRGYSQIFYIAFSFNIILFSVSKTICLVLQQIIKFERVAKNCKLDKQKKKKKGEYKIFTKE